MTDSGQPDGKRPARLILASASPRRLSLLQDAGFLVEVKPPTREEPTERKPGHSPAEHAEFLSYFKASCVAETVADGLIIAADTVAELNGRVFGKPTDRAHAKSILSELSGTTHHVVTGVTLFDARTRESSTKHDRTAVVMKAMGDQQIEAYLSSGAWQGKAGAYGIQDHGDEFVERIEGSFSNVVGLPMELLQRMLAVVLPPLLKED